MKQRHLSRCAALVLVGWIAIVLPASIAEAEDGDCRGCHEDFVDRLDDEFDHPPFIEGRCLDCHQFHEFQPRAELNSTLLDVCLKCHAEVMEVPASLLHGSLELEDSCILCHNPHSAPNERLLRKPVPELCLDCHDGVDETAISSHAPVVDGDCGSCHDPHGTYFRPLFHLPAAYTCQGCHDGIVPEAGPDVMHPGDGSISCIDCHSGHASDNPSLLLEPATELCSACHDVEPRPGAAWHGAVTELGCGGCHDPHFDTTVSELPEADARFCASCHAEVVSRLDLETPHAVAEDCSICHEVHERLTQADVPDLCGGCHDVGDHTVLEVPVGGACTSCHDPHGTETTALLLDLEHPPFEEGECESCHDPDEPEALGTNDLCLACHDDPGREGAHKLVGSLAGARRCVECHSPHASGRKALLRALRPLAN